MLLALKSGYEQAGKGEHRSCLQDAIGFLALNCSDFQTRHGGVSVGLVDELNHFSSQMLPVGEAKLLSLSYGFVIGSISPSRQLFHCAGG